MAGFDDIPGFFADLFEGLTAPQYSKEQKRIMRLQGDSAALSLEDQRRRQALVGPQEDAQGNLTGPTVDALNMIMGNAQNVGGRSRQRVQARPFNPFGEMRDVQTFGAQYGPPAEPQSFAGPSPAEPEREKPKEPDYYERTSLTPRLPTGGGAGLYDYYKLRGRMPLLPSIDDGDGGPSDYYDMASRIPKFRIDEETGGPSDYYDMASQMPRFRIDEETGGEGISDYYNRDSRMPRFGSEEETGGPPSMTASEYANLLLKPELEIASPDITAASYQERLNEALRLPDNEAGLEIQDLLNRPDVKDMITSGRISMPPGFRMGANGIGIAPGFSVSLVIDWINQELRPGDVGGSRSGVGGTTPGGQIGWGTNPRNRYGIQDPDKDRYNVTGSRG